MLSLLLLNKDRAIGIISETMYVSSTRRYVAESSSGDAYRVTEQKRWFRKRIHTVKGRKR
jgi:hypothetical protein